MLVQGGSSGIGVTAIQIARAIGHRVFVTAGTAEKCRRANDWVPSVRQLQGRGFRRGGEVGHGRRGVDVILDMVAGDYARAN